MTFMTYFIVPPDRTNYVSPSFALTSLMFNANIIEPFVKLSNWAKEGKIILVGLLSLCWDVVRH